MYVPSSLVPSLQVKVALNSMLTIIESHQQALSRGLGMRLCFEFVYMYIKVTHDDYSTVPSHAVIMC